MTKYDLDLMLEGISDDSIIGSGNLTGYSPKDDKHVYNIDINTGCAIFSKTLKEKLDITEIVLWAEE